ncbi:unnamed protein product [Onchocerca flexuosa]|uniref:30S ribosomal protein S15 n=1 Tax=Onchocerca flexuosa TaxID=387005 RepID=A0A183H767_9BILA|nr:unnamed protein product [Onchocerca flexuosa]
MKSERTVKDSDDRRFVAHLGDKHEEGTLETP